MNMGLTSLQVCMDSASSDWLQGTSHEDSPVMESSPSPLSPNDMLTCSRPVSMDRRLRPPHDQALKCPRCDSTHTKFCYYNNYSLTQPRYFCKTCRRYWTKGGTLRNIPVGGGCRKNKKPSSSSKKQNDNAHPVVGENGTTDLQLSFPDQLHFSHIATNLFGHNNHLNNSNGNFLPIDFMESKLEGIVGNSHNYDFMGNNGNLGMVNLGHHHGLLMEHDFHGNNICAPFGMSLLHGNNNVDTTTVATATTTTTIAANNGAFLDTCQRLMLPYNGMNHDEQSAVDVKPNAKLLSLDWQQEQACSSGGHAGTAKDSFGYLNALGSWPSMVNNYGPSTTNPLV